MMAEPRSDPVPELLQQRTSPAAELVRRHPPVLRHEHKPLLYAIASPPGAAPGQGVGGESLMGATAL